MRLVRGSDKLTHSVLTETTVEVLSHCGVFFLKVRLHDSTSHITCLPCAGADGKEWSDGRV